MPESIVYQIVKSYLERLEKDGNSKTEIERLTGVTRATQYRIHDGKNKNVRKDTQTRIEKAFPYLLGLTEKDAAQIEIEEYRKQVIELQGQIIELQKKVDLSRDIESYIKERDAIKRELEDYREILEKKKRIEKKKG